MFLRLSLLAPFFCAIYPFLSLYLRNVHYFPILEVVEVTIAILVILLLCLIAILKLVKNEYRALCYLWFIVIALGSSQYISQGIYVITGSRGGFALTNTISFIVWVSILWSMFRCLLKLSDKALRSTLEIVSVFALMLFGVALSSQLSVFFKSKDAFKVSDSLIESNPGDSWNHSYQGGTQGQAIRPDIYFVMTDGLARGDVLKEIYDYDSAGFEAGLEAQGMYIFKQARSNYASTLLSFPSMLNYNYISNSIDSNLTDRGGLIRAFNENKVISNLHKSGYKVMSFESAFQGTQGLTGEKIKASEGYTNAFLLASSVILSFPPVGDLLSYWQRDIHRTRSKTLLEQIGKLPCDQKQPKFVLGHLLMPHPPFVVDRHGNDVDLGEPSNLDGLRNYNYPMYKHHYSEQARYVHTSLIEAVREIKQSSCRPTYIIVTADHGPLLKEVKHGPASPDMLRERMSIFAAVYYPDNDYSKLTPDSTPINIVRTTFTHTGLASLSPLPDKSLYSTWDAPYDFKEIRVADKFERLGQ